MSLPTFVYVAPYDIAVCTDRSRLSDIADNGVPVLGHYSGRTCTITVDTDQDRSQLADTLLHETLHAILAQTGLALDSESEEQIVAAMSPRLLGVLRDNPGLVGFLIAT